MINSGDKMGNASGWRRAVAVEMEVDSKNIWKVDFPGMVMDKLWREKEDVRDSFESSDILQFLFLLHG